MSDIASRGYAHPEVLVSTEWVAAHLNDPNVRIIESNEDPLLYPSGHIPGAVEVDWTTDLNDQVVRDYVGREAFAALASRIGITPDTTVVFYGDKNNWWATYAFWVFQLFGHKNARVMDGGRKKWVDEGRELTRDVPTYPPTVYPRRSATTLKSAPSAITCSNMCRLAVSSSTCAAQPSTLAKNYTWRATRRRVRCAAATSQARRTSPGRVQPTKMVRSKMLPR
jgi:hypothetical protein